MEILIAIAVCLTVILIAIICRLIILDVRPTPVVVVPPQEKPEPIEEDAGHPVIDICNRIDDGYFAVYKTVGNSYLFHCPNTGFSFNAKYVCSDLSLNFNTEIPNLLASEHLIIKQAAGREIKRLKQIELDQAKSQSRADFIEKYDAGEL